MTPLNSLIQTAMKCVYCQRPMLDRCKCAENRNEVEHELVDAVVEAIADTPGPVKLLNELRRIVARYENDPRMI